MSDAEQKKASEAGKPHIHGADGNQLQASGMTEPLPCREAHEA
jgi:hypothetical protein